MTESLIGEIKRLAKHHGYSEMLLVTEIINAVKKHEHTHHPREDFKFGRARATLTSIMPYCHNGEKVVTALCEICGTIKGFTLGDNAGFPDSGYWTECRACQSWTMFYRLDGHGYIKRKHVGEGPGL